MAIGFQERVGLRIAAVANIEVLFFHSLAVKVPATQQYRFYAWLDF